MYEIYGNINLNEVIVAIPALGERREMFQPLANKMNNYRWLVFDLPGSNKEQVDDYSIPAFCEYIKQTLNSLNIGKAHFLGNSLGAWVIQAFTSSYPEYVRSLALLDGGHYFLGERNEPHEDVELPSAIENFDDIRNAVKELTYSMPNLESQAYINFENYFLNNYMKQGDFYAHHCCEAAYNSLSKEISSTNYCLKEIAVPTVLLIAEASTDEISLNKATIFNEQFEQAKVVCIDKGQHYLPLTNTDAVAKNLEAFLKMETFVK
ncbi:alpha/beta hydrolase [Solibacillus sp. FSL W7-1464]|uniref:alpha/beta fold hydrolase n=1 Tax=Solibacillus sp. FSL W7-1464 TaxID=2921706 RepID=UPI0030F6FCA5